MVSTVGACELIRWTQPPDAENRMSGGVGGLTGEIPLARPDRLRVTAFSGAFTVSRFVPSTVGAGGGVMQPESITDAIADAIKLGIRIFLIF